MELGRLNMKHNVFPRVKEYTSERLRQMIERSVAGGSNDDMCCVDMVQVPSHCLSTSCYSAG